MSISRGVVIGPTALLFYILTAGGVGVSMDWHIDTMALLLYGTTLQVLGGYMENQFKDNRHRFFHKPNAPLWLSDDGDDWGWMLHGNWHRYYGPQNNNGSWYLEGEYLKNE